MADKKPHLMADVKYIETPKQKPSIFDAQDCGVPTTNVS